MSVTYLLRSLVLVSKHGRVVSLDVERQGWSLDVSCYFVTIVGTTPSCLYLLALLKWVSVVVFLNRTIGTLSKREIGVLVHKTQHLVLVPLE